MDMYITLTGFSVSERDALYRAIGSLCTPSAQSIAKLSDLVHASNASKDGGAYTTILVAKSLVASFGSEKFSRAISWGVPVVSWRWIERSIALGSIQPLDKYKTDDDSSVPQFSEFISQIRPSELANQPADKERQDKEIIKCQKLFLKKSEISDLSEEVKNKLNTPAAQSRSASSSHIPSQLSLNQMAPDLYTNHIEAINQHSDVGGSEFSFRLHPKSQQHPLQLDFQEARDDNAMDISPEMNSGFKSCSRARLTPMSIDGSGSRRCFSFSPIPVGLEISMTPATAMGATTASPASSIGPPPSALVQHDMIIPATQCEELSSHDSPQSLITYLKTRQCVQGMLKDVGRAEGKTSTRLLYSWSNGSGSEGLEEEREEKARSLMTSQYPTPSMGVSLASQVSHIEQDDVIEVSDPVPALPGIQPQNGRLSEFIDPGLPQNTFEHHQSSPGDMNQDLFSSPPHDLHGYEHKSDAQRDPDDSIDEIEDTEEEDEGLFHELEDDLEDQNAYVKGVIQSRDQSKLTRLRRGSFVCPPSIVKQPSSVQNLAEPEERERGVNVKSEGERLKGGGGAAARALAAARAARLAPTSIPEVAVKQELSSAVPPDGRVIVLKLLARPPRGTTVEENCHVCPNGSSLKGVEFVDEIKMNGTQVICRDGKKKISCPLLLLPLPHPSSYIHSERRSSAQPFAIEPFAIYRRGDGDWWIEFNRILSFDDALRQMQGGDRSVQKASWLPRLASDFDPTKEVFRVLQREHSRLSNLCQGEVILHKTKKLTTQTFIKLQRGTRAEDKVFFQRFGWDIEEKRVLVALDGQDLVLD